MSLSVEHYNHNPDLKSATALRKIVGLVSQKFVLKKAKFKNAVTVYVDFLQSAH